MALTNAERQARYRKSLKARASGLALGERARAAMTVALSAIWDCDTRSDRPALGDFADVQEFLKDCATPEKGRPLPGTALLLDAEKGDGFTEAEWLAILIARELIAATALEHHK